MEVDLKGVKLEPAYTENNTIARPWFRRWWFISILVLIVLWFGLPFIITPLVEKYEVGRVLQNTETPLSKVGLSLLETTDDPFIGYTDAPVVIVEFLDYQCPFCKQAVPIMKQVLSTYPDTVKLIIRDFPIDSVHPEAISAAVAANCAQAQGNFWEYHDALYDQQDELGENLYQSLARQFNLDLTKFDSCSKSLAVRKEIGDDYDAGIKAGVGGTPTFFVNGQKVEGPLPIDLWKQIIKLSIENRFK